MTYICALLLAALAFADDSSLAIDNSDSSPSDISLASDSSPASDITDDSVITLVGPYRIVYQVTKIDEQTVSPEATEFTVSSTVSVPSPTGTEIPIDTPEAESKGNARKLSTNWYEGRRNKWGWFYPQFPWYK